jgi:hypothetical protein
MKKLLMLTTGLAMLLALGLLLYVSQAGWIDLAVAQEGVEVPFLEEWAASPHADAAAEAFVHWNEEDPAEVPVECAKCHSTAGYQDFLGADGSAAGAVDAAAPIGGVVECVACHNNATLVKTSVVMPSGLEITGLGDEARCMECHQGRQSTVSVNEAITEAGVEEDTVSEDLGFLNIHYYAAAATKYGTLAKGGYEYEGQSYDANFAHVEEFDSCIECHDSHTLEVQVESCSNCHEGVAGVEDLRNIRMQGSLVDYDGDGDVEEGISFELEGLQAQLYTAIQAYAADVAGSPIVYDAATHPYFFIDTNSNGETDTDEVNFDNRYASWTPRLLKATYNYQTSIKDPGAFAHGPKYIIQLLSDSIADLNTGLPQPAVDMAAMNRLDDGHFAGSEEAFRHWDEEGGIVEAGCVKCHTAEGLPMFLENGATVATPASNGLQCTTCHSDLESFTLYEVAEVEFPSGAVLTAEEPANNLCLQCHQGRTSTVSMNEAIGDADLDTVSENLRFQNIHYFAAGATRFGGEAMGGYQYEGKEYAGFFEHVGGFDGCIECHSAHGLDVQVAECADCHDGADAEEGLRTIRESDTDFDGDGDAEEGIAEEIETMREALYTALQDHAANEVGTAIGYNPSSHPYFFIDTDGDGEISAEEAVGDNRYATWTPRLLQAAYNYQYTTKDPGQFAHNAPYIMQLLYDSLESLGADVSGMTRP